MESRKTEAQIFTLIFLIICLKLHYDNNTASITSSQSPGGIYYKDRSVYSTGYDIDIVNSTSMIDDHFSLAKITRNSTVEWFYDLGGSNLTMDPQAYLF